MYYFTHKFISIIILYNIKVTNKHKEIIINIVKKKTFTQTEFYFNIFLNIE